MRECYNKWCQYEFLGECHAPDDLFANCEERQEEEK